MLGYVFERSLMKWKSQTSERVIIKQFYSPFKIFESLFLFTLLNETFFNKLSQNRLVFVFLMFHFFFLIGSFMLSDATLVQKTLAGDKQAYEELVRRYSSGLCGYIHHQVKNFSDAEDISQESFLKAYCHLAELRNPSQFASWLFRIAKNTCLDWKRKRPQLFVTLSQDIPAQKSSTETSENPWKCLDRLPEKYRIPLLLKHHQKFSCQEIAQNLNLSLPAVTKRLSRAYQMIRNEMKRLEES